MDAVFGALDGGGDHEKLELLDALLWQVNLLHMRGSAIAQLLHDDGEYSGGKRSILRNLVRDGPMTVPQLARMRPVSRQFIQRLVNELAGDGFVELVPNPAHRRSKLVQVTPLGRQRFVELARREAAVGRVIGDTVTPEDLRQALVVLQHLQERMLTWHEHRHAEPADAP